MPPLPVILTSELPRLIVIAPAFNEESAIPAFLRELAVVATSIVAERRIYVVIVDDGSSDDTALRALDAAEKTGLPLSLVRLARNFGQQAAFQAGMQHAFQLGDEADVFVLIDSDLQHPPSLLVSMLREMENGVDHVQMLRNSDEALPYFKRLTSDAFYRLLKLVSGLHTDPGASDFRMFEVDPKI